MVGSPEWFHHEATKEEYINFQEKVEAKRAKFIESFSPEKISRMDEEELLQKVFGSELNTMMELLNYYYDYADFGSTGHSKHLRPLYQLFTTQKEWKRFECKEELSHDEALEYAVKYRDDIIESVNLISSMELNSIEEYEELREELGTKQRFLMFAPMLKYYQMIFPQYFPGIYSKGILVRT